MYPLPLNSFVKYLKLSILEFRRCFILNHSFVDMDRYVISNSLLIPFVMWLLFNIVPVFFGSLLVTYVEVSSSFER